MARRRCIELTLLVVGSQLLLTISAVWFMRSHNLPVKDPDQRLLLSVDYAVSSTGESTEQQNNKEQVPSHPVLKQTSFSSGSSSEEQMNFDEYSSSLDKYRLFKSNMFAVTGDDWTQLSQERKVCLGAQTSIDRSYWLIEMAKHWTGPISIALFVPDVEFHISKIYVAYMRKCFPSVARQVSFHFTFPSKHPVKESEDLLDVDVSAFSCEEPKEVIKTLIEARPKEMLSWRESFAYPQNLLRNLAKSGCQTEYTFIPDIDMIPIKGLDVELDDFLSQKEQESCKKCAYVIPTYEIDTSVPVMPENKTDLLSLVKHKKARRFHQVVYKLNQQSSDLDKWEKMLQQPTLARGYKIKSYRFKYEPLYVARADTPIFDERFIGFGMTRNTQVYEMYVAGYEFIVLNNAFTNHAGFQTIRQRPKWRAKQQEANNKKVDEFALELIAKYGKDPYNMKTKLKQFNFKHIHVGYGSWGADVKKENKS